jgi:hypothetical protein
VRSSHHNLIDQPKNQTILTMSDESAQSGKHEKVLNAGGLRRRTEDVKYWRERAGWFDDDTSMQNYNSGVYDTYYQLDDNVSHRPRHSNGVGGAHAALIQNVVKAVVILVALCLCAFVLRIFLRRLASSKHDNNSDSKTRLGRTRSRSRSKSRTRRSAGDAYDLMEDEADTKSARSSRSKRSTRSKSKSRRSRSLTRPRSRSTSRIDKELASSETPIKTSEPVLV